MPAQRSALRNITEVLRLKFEARFSHERIAAATGLSKGAVSNDVQRAHNREGDLREPDERLGGPSRALPGGGLLRE